MGVWLAGVTAAPVVGFVPTAGITGRLGIDSGMGIDGVGSATGFAGSGVGINTGPGTVDGAATGGTTGVGGSTGSKRPGGTGATGFAGAIRSGSTLVRGAAGGLNEGLGTDVVDDVDTAGIAGLGVGFLPKSRPIMPGRFELSSSVGVTVGLVGAAVPDAPGRPPIGRLSREDSDIGGIVVGLD